MLFVVVLVWLITMERYNITIFLHILLSNWLLFLLWLLQEGGEGEEVEVNLLL